MPDHEHSDYGGSVADKWINCPGYIQAVAHLPKQPPTIHTVSGTAQHALVEHIALTGKRPEDFVGKPWMGEIPIEFAGHYDDENVARARVWINAIHDHCDPLQFTLEIEEPVVLSSISPACRGTGDLFAIDRAAKHLVVADYKDGAGKIVDVLTTPQPRFYAVGADDTFGLEIDASWTVDYLIVQPKAPTPLTMCRKSGKDVAEWRGIFKYAYERSLDPHAPRVAGDHCGWCRAAGDCAALAESKRLSVKREFGSPVAPQSLTPEQISNILRVAPEVESWLNEVQKHALAQALAGSPPPGFRVVEGRAGPRKWGDEAAAEEALVAALKDRAYERSLLSPTKAEKALGKDDFKALAQFITQNAGAPKLAPAGSEKENFTKQALARKEFAS
jgi:hypothetical protein